MDNPCMFSSLLLHGWCGLSMRCLIWSRDIAGGIRVVFLYILNVSSHVAIFLSLLCQESRSMSLYRCYSSILSRISACLASHLLTCPNVSSYSPLNAVNVIHFFTLLSGHVPSCPAVHEMSLASKERFNWQVFSYMRIFLICYCVLI